MWVLVKYVQKQPPELFTGKHLCKSLFFNKVAGAACSLCCGWCFLKEDKVVVNEIYSLVSIQPIWFCLALGVYNKTNILCHVWYRK